MNQNSNSTPAPKPPPPSQAPIAAVNKTDVQAIKAGQPINDIRTIPPSKKGK